MLIPPRPSSVSCSGSIVCLPAHLEETYSSERYPHSLRASELRGPLEPHAGDAGHNRQGHRSQQVEPSEGDHAVVHLGGVGRGRPVDERGEGRTLTRL